MAARSAGRVHEAARCCPGPGQGGLDRAAFEEIFPWRTGRASAVLTEGLFVPAGTGYRFAHEELGDWVQGAHPDLGPALQALVHRVHQQPGAGAAPGTGPARHRPPPSVAAATATGAPTGRSDAPAGSTAPEEAARAADAAPTTGPAHRTRPLPVPRHVAGPVVQALPLPGRRQGPERWRTAWPVSSRPWTG